MKKLLSIIFVLCLAMAVIALVPVSAADDPVLRGTPVIDGKVDDIYKKSLTIYYDGDESKNTSVVMEGKWVGGTATFYALYDARYVYVVADVKDDDVVSAADVYVYENNNPYGNDVVEFRFDLGGGDPWDDSTFFKIGIDAYGKNIYSPDSLGIGCDLNEVYYATTITEDGYIVEVAVPHDTRPQDDVIGVGKLGLKCWVFDLPAEHAGIEAPVQDVHFYHYTQSIEGEGPGDRVFYPLSDEKAVADSETTADTTTKEPEVTTKEPEVTTKEPEVTTKEPEVTTKEPEVTTKEPEVTTEEPEVTTEEPEVTTEEPEVTTEEPEVTTEEPEVTTEEPEVTTEEPEVTTEEPEVTTEEPDAGTTTKADDTTAKAPDTGDTDGKPSAAIPVAIAAIVIVAVVVVLAVVLKKKH